MPDTRPRVYTLILKCHPVTVNDHLHAPVLTNESTIALECYRILGLLVWLPPSDERSEFASAQDHEISGPLSHH